MPPLSAVAFFMEHGLAVYTNDGKLIKMDFTQYTISEVKMKSNIQDRNSVVKIVKLSAHAILCYSVDNCFYMMFFPEEKGRQIGFVCPYCLHGWAFVRHLRAHIDSHIGPVSCKICQVKTLRFFL